jgi:hypothetical protein
VLSECNHTCALVTRSSLGERDIDLIAPWRLRAKRSPPLLSPHWTQPFHARSDRVRQHCCDASAQSACWPRPYPGWRPHCSDNFVRDQTRDRAHAWRWSMGRLHSAAFPQNSRPAWNEPARRPLQDARRIMLPAPIIHPVATIEAMQYRDRSTGFVLGSRASQYSCWFYSTTKPFSTFSYEAGRPKPQSTRWPCFPLEIRSASTIRRTACVTQLPWLHALL